MDPLTAMALVAVYGVVVSSSYVAERMQGGGLAHWLERRRLRPRGDVTRVRGVVEPLTTMASPVRGHRCVGALVELAAARRAFPWRRRVSTVQDFILRTTEGAVLVRGAGAILDVHATAADALPFPPPAALREALAGAPAGDLLFSELPLFAGETVEVTGRLVREPAPPGLVTSYRGDDVPALVAAGPSLFVRTV